MELQFTNRQTLWKDVWWDLCQYVIDQAIESGELPGDKMKDEYTGELTYYLLSTPDTDDGSQEQITRDVSITFPPLLEHDVLQTVQAIISAATIDNKTLAGTMDRKTMAGLLLRALKVENADQILESIPEEPQYDRVTPPPAPDAGGFSGIDYTEESLNNLLKDTIKDVQNAARKLQEADDPEGQWVTINGVHILIKKGEDAAQAFKRTTGKNLESPQDKGGAIKEKPTKTTIKKITSQKPEAIREKCKSLYQKKGLDKQLSDAYYSDTELDSIGVYQGSGYKAINGHLRGNKDIPKLSAHSGKVEDHVKNLNLAIDKCPTPDGMPLYRGISGSASARLTDAKVGDIFEDKGFQSFSADPSQAKHWTKGEAGKKTGVMVQYITGPKDKALPLWGGESPEESEFEFLLKPGKFKVMGTIDYENTKVIQLAAA